MNPLHKQASANGITNTGTRDRNNELWAAVVAGDQAARKEMIESNMALVMVKVEAFIATFPKSAYLRDDMTSEGLLGLVEGVDNMIASAKGRKSLDPPNPSGYLQVAISRAIGNLYDTECNLQMPAPTARLQRQKGRLVPKQSCCTVLPESVVDDTKLRELRDLVMSCAETNDERTLLRMREEGYTDSEIAKAIGLSRTPVLKLRQKLYQRYLEKVAAIGDE